MKIVDLSHILEAHDLDKSNIARLLFPTNLHPNVAIKRVLTGEAQLDASQLARLAEFLGVEVSDLYSKQAWNVKSKNGVIQFNLNNFLVELDLSTGVSKIFDNDSLFYEKVLHTKAVALSDYISQLNKIIDNYKTKENE